MAFLASFLLYYFLFLLAASAGSISLAVLNLNLGLRTLYIDTLLRLFKYVASMYSRQEFDEDDESVESDTPKSKIDDGGGLVTQGSIEEMITPRKVSFVPARLLVRRKSIEEMMVLSARRGDELLIDEFTRDLCRWATVGINSIVADSFTESLKTAEIPTWNLLSRSNNGLVIDEHFPLLFIWVLTLLFRYCFLFPTRILIGTFALLFLLISSNVTHLLPSAISSRVEKYVHVTFFRILGRCISLSVSYHNPENKAKAGGICVANHTSPIDVLPLAMDNYYSLVGQKHGGVLGTVEVALGRLSSHIWLERGDRASREVTVARLRNHVENDMQPVLLFPEGVCVNNTKVLRFRKGSFELGATIYPVAIKYDRRFGDPFWVEATWLQHQISLMTCWGIKADVFYLPPMRQADDETSAHFANRVKEAIATEGGFVQVDFDGFLQYKPQMVKTQADRVKVDYSKRIRHLSGQRGVTFQPEVPKLGPD